MLTLGVNGALVHARGAAGGKHDMTAGKGQNLTRFGGYAGNTRDTRVVGEDLDHSAVVDDLHALAQHRALQRLGHIAGGQRPTGGGAGARIVIGLVACVFAVFVGGKGHAQLHQVHEAACGIGGLTKGMLAHDAAARIKGLGQLSHAVTVRAGEGELIISLLVAARIAGGAHQPPLGDDGNIPHAEVVKAIGGAVAGAARADDQGMIVLLHRRLICIPPSRIKDSPVA